MKQTAVSTRVWRRTVAMLFVAMRYEIELRNITQQPLEDDEEFSESLVRILGKHPALYKELTSNEKILLEYEIGAWPMRIHTQYSWHIEAVGCLLWSLDQLNPFPDHDKVFDTTAVDKYFGDVTNRDKPGWTTRLLEKEFPLRNGVEIQRQLKRAELVYQRCLIGSFIRDGKRKMTTKRYEDLFPYAEYDLPIGPSGDLVVEGKEFCDMSHDDEGNIAPLGLIRIQTFRWVMDPSDGWDNLTVDYLEKLPK
jgi:hypothetical protein